LFSHLD